MMWKHVQRNGCEEHMLCSNDVLKGWGTHLFRNRGDFCANWLLWYVDLQDHAWDSLDNHEQACCAMLLCIRTAGQLSILQLRENAALDISCASILNTCPTISVNPMSYTAGTCLHTGIFVVYCFFCWLFSEKVRKGHCFEEWNTIFTQIVPQTMTK